MRLFGLIDELQKIVFRKSGNTISIEPAAQTGSSPTVSIPDLIDSGTHPLVLTDVAQTLTSKSLVDNSTVFIDNSDPTIQVKINAAGTTGTATTILSSQSSNATLTLPTATGRVLSDISPDNVQNKVISASTISVADSGLSVTKAADATAIAKLAVSTAAATTATLTLPPTTTTIVGTTSTQTLTNKTLTGNIAANLVSGTGTLVLPTSGTVNVPNPSTTDTVALLAAAQNLTSKNIDGSANTITNVGIVTGTIGTLTVGRGGTGQTTALAGFNALSPLTTKGDILTSNGTNNIRVPVGPDGQALFSDSAQASGLTWAPALSNPMTSVGDVIVGGTAGAATRLPVGAANTVLGVNAAGTTGEYKALATGTTGTNFAIVHTANTVTFNLPDASITARGAINTTTQTIVGVKSFNDQVNALSGVSTPWVIFPATQNPSAGANTLDDYEEGTWTPTIISTGGGTPIYSVQSGAYVKIGKQVSINCRIALSSLGTLAAGDVQVSSLPFTTTSAVGTPGSVGIYSGISMDKGLFVNLETNNNIGLRTTSVTNTITTKVADLVHNSSINISLVYYAS